MRFDKLEQFIKKSNVSAATMIVTYIVFVMLFSTLVIVTPEIPNDFVLIAGTVIPLISPYYSRFSLYILLIVFNSITGYVFYADQTTFIDHITLLALFDIFLIIVSEGFVSLYESQKAAQTQLQQKI